MRAYQRGERWDLYEKTVQNPRLAVRLLRAIHASGPGLETRIAKGGGRSGPTKRKNGRGLVLGEDFSGSAAVSREWVSSVGGKDRAIAIDIDETALALSGRSKRIQRIVADVRAVPRRARGLRKCDVVFVGNFSIGEIHDRGDLVAYLRSTRGRLAPGGVFVCDTYGGATAFTRGSMSRTVVLGGGIGGRRVGSRKPRKSDSGCVVRYTWQQREADPLTGMVENAVHLRVMRGSEVLWDVADAFVYRWRLWSVPELRDAMREAGLGRTAVFGQVPDAQEVEQGARRAAARADRVLAIESPEELDETFVVCVAGWAR